MPKCRITFQCKGCETKNEIEAELPKYGDHEQVKAQVTCAGCETLYRVRLWRPVGVGTSSLKLDYDVLKVSDKLHQIIKDKYLARQRATQ